MSTTEAAGSAQNEAVITRVTSGTAPARVTSASAATKVTSETAARAKQARKRSLGSTLAAKRAMVAATAAKQTAAAKETTTPTGKETAAVATSSTNQAAAEIEMRTGLVCASQDTSRESSSQQMKSDVQIKLTGSSSMSLQLATDSGPEAIEARGRSVMISQREALPKCESKIKRFKKSWVKEVVNMSKSDLRNLDGVNSGFLASVQSELIEICRALSLYNKSDTAGLKLTCHNVYRINY